MGSTFLIYQIRVRRRIRGGQLVSPQMSFAKRYGVKRFCSFRDSEMHMAPDQLTMSVTDLVGEIVRSMNVVYCGHVRTK